MKTSLQDAHSTQDRDQSPEEHSEEEGHHIHLPNPSLWPFILSAAILVTVTGLLFIPDNPWLSIVGAPFILVGIMGWALENPMAKKAPQDGSKVYNPSLTPQDVLKHARDVADRVVTISSTAYSAHPVKVELESEDESKGVVLALYGKVELDTQRQELEQTLLKLPNVIGVRNFLVAEDAILETANARLEKLEAQGKLKGANNLSILVEHYILQLYGDVPNTEMKYMLERELLGISGVRVVVNHIGLNEAIPGDLGRTLNKVGG